MPMSTILFDEFYETIEGLDRNRQIIEAIKAGQLFDYICKYGYMFKNHELIDVIKELDSAIYVVLLYNDKKALNEIREETFENLCQRWFIEEE